jgi:protein involved in ribonucleotide reduction
LTNKQTNTITVERVGSANLGTLRANAINFSSSQTDDDTTFFKRTSDDRVGVIPPTGPQTAVAYLSDISGTTLNLASINTSTALISMTQVQVTVAATTANMDTGPQLIGTTASGNYSIGGHHVTTGGIISSVKINVPNVYTYVSAGNWYWDAEVSGATSNTSETWTVVIVKYAPGISTQTGVVGP